MIVSIGSGGFCNFSQRFDRDEFFAYLEHCRLQQNRLPSSYAVRLTSGSTKSLDLNYVLYFYRHKDDVSSSSFRPNETASPRESMAGIIRNWYWARIEKTKDDKWALVEMHVKKDPGYDETVKIDLADPLRGNVYVLTSWYSNIDLARADIVKRPTDPTTPGIAAYDVLFAPEYASEHFVERLSFWFDVNRGGAIVRWDEKKVDRDVSSTVLFDDWHQIGDVAVPLASKTYYPGLDHANHALFWERTIEVLDENVGADHPKLSLSHYGIPEPLMPSDGRWRVLWWIVVGVILLAVTTIIGWSLRSKIG